MTLVRSTEKQNISLVDSVSLRFNKKENGLEVIFFYYGNTWNGKIWFSNVKKMPYANFIFFAIWIPSSNIYLLRFDTNLEKNIAGDICKIAKKYLPHFANGYILPFHFFCHDKRNHFWNFVFFFILLHFSHLRCV